jgi:hypothetical protein
MMVRCTTVFANKFGTVYLPYLNKTFTTTAQDAEVRAAAPGTTYCKSEK